MENIVIRKVNVSDVEVLSTLAKQTFYNAFSGTCTVEDMAEFLEIYYNPNALKKQIENENVQYYFAEVNGIEVAYISFGNENPNFAITNNKKALELKRLYVLDEYHSKGIAQKLIELYLDYAFKENYDFAFLGVWQYNYKAQNFYKKYGFEHTKYRHPFPIGLTPQTDIYMIKKLQSKN